MGDLALSYRPHPSLRDQVRRIAGFTEHASGPVHRRELPHAGIPIIISFGDRFRIDSSASQGQHTSFLAGLHEIPVDTEHDGTMRCIQVDLTPPAAYQLLGLPMSELTDRVVDLDLLGWADLGDRLASASGWAERFRLVEQALGHRLEDGRPTDPEVDWAWHALHRTHGAIPVGRLAEEVGWSRRHFTARFRQQIGLPPKATGQLLRFSHALTLLDTGPAGTIADIAAQAGYSDHSHLVREFRRLTGAAPTELSADRPVTFVQDGAQSSV